MDDSGMFRFKTVDPAGQVLNYGCIFPTGDVVTAWTDENGDTSSVVHWTSWDQFERVSFAPQYGNSARQAVFYDTADECPPRPKAVSTPLVATP